MAAGVAATAAPRGKKRAAAADTINDFYLTHHTPTHKNKNKNKNKSIIEKSRSKTYKSLDERKTPTLKQRSNTDLSHTHTGTVITVNKIHHIRTHDTHTQDTRLSNRAPATDLSSFFVAN